MSDPAAIPVVEAITLNVLATVAQVTTADNWSHTIIPTRTRRSGVVSDPNVISAVLREGDRVPQPSPQGAKDWHQPYELRLEAFESDASDAPPARQVLQVAAAEVEDALRQDYTRNGLAINTMFDEAPQWPNDGESHGSADAILVKFTVWYRTLLNNPFAIGG